MASIDKLIEKMRNQPNGITFHEVMRVLVSKKYKLGRQSGSHCQFINKSGDVLTIPKRNPLKRVYVEIILDRIGEK
jgi:predicted RNA binding protein YcfA (HicA-like mRNA interferase family)